MRTDFLKYDTAEDDDSGGLKFFNWAIIVVAAALLVAVTSEFVPVLDGQQAAASARPAAAVETVNPRKT
jgi:hypothetical protein